jgi:RNA polymerase sigma factor (sigma-70 family)
MATAVERVVQALRMRSIGCAESDRGLLRAFAESGDESAFTELVRRHGPLVLGVCRRILGNVQDAEDAFQATFLVLARKASALQWQDSIKNWLHGVACRVAMKARGQIVRRRQKERAACAPVDDANAGAQAWNDLRAVLDEELQQLPDKYRAVLLLCYLEGKTRDEAAETLGWSAGSVKGLLERGREMLRARLVKRGLTLAAALTAALVSDSTIGAASISSALTVATVQSAGQFLAGSAGQALLAPPVLTLAQGVLNAMLLAKIKAIGFVTMMLILSAGALIGVHQAASDHSVAAAGVANLPGSPVLVAQERDGRKDEPKKKADAFGLVKAIDLKVGTLTISSLRDGDRDDATFNLGAKDLKVSTTFGESMKITEVTAGMRVHLQLKELDVMAIHVENPVVPAFFNSVDAEKRVVEARAERKIAQYAVAKDAKITIAGKVLKLAEVPLDERVFITLSLDKKTILAMHANKAGGERPKGDRPMEERPPVRVPTVNATIIDIDASKDTVSVLTGRDGEQKIGTLSIPKDMKIKVQFEGTSVQDVALAQLTKPLQAIVVRSDDGKTVSALTVLAPTARGTIKSIDAAGKKVTLTEADRAEKTYELADTVHVRSQLREAPGKLTDVTLGMNVILGLSLDRTRVIAIVPQGPGRRDGERP